MAADAADDFARRLFHAGEPALQEIRSRGRPCREEQDKEQHEYDGQDIHPQDLTRSEPDAPAKISTAQRRALPTAVGRCLISGLVRSPDRNNCGLRLPACVFWAP